MTSDLMISVNLGGYNRQALTMTLGTSISPNSTVYTNSCSCKNQRFALSLVEEPFDPTYRVRVRDVRERVDECWVFGRRQRNVGD
jgi:hypothetical protein